MIEHLAALIPDAEALLALEPEELGAKLLFIYRQHGGREFHFGNLIAELPGGMTGRPPYARDQHGQINRAIREAAAWLEAQGLLIPADGTNGTNGWKELSRRAYKFQDAWEFATYIAARRLDRTSLHPAIRERVWAAFMRNEFDTAAFLAMKAVEVPVREAGDFEDGVLGVKLARASFDVDAGPLTDQEAERGERQGMSDLFAGALAVFKNPQSHRQVDLTDPVEATEIVMLANMLLRIVDRRAPQK